MNTSDPISRFLSKQTCATICCIDNTGLPYCFSCYYVFNPVNRLLYFKSSAETEHAVYLSGNPSIFGTVLPDSLNKFIVKGIQFQGTVISENDKMAQDAVMYYYKHNPMAIAMKGKVFTIRIDSLKMTDSSKVFGKKTTWQRTIEKKIDSHIEFKNIHLN